MCRRLLRIIHCPSQGPSNVSYHITPYSDEIGPLPEHLCLKNLPEHLYLRDKDDSNSAQPMQCVRLKEQLMLRADSPVMVISVYEFTALSTEI